MSTGVAGRPLQVVVIGGGIGGLCLAQGLKKAGIAVAVYERDASPASREQGYRVHIDPTGSRSLNQCLPPALWRVFVDTAGNPGEGFGFFDERLSPLCLVENEIMTGGATDPAAGNHAASRLTLRQVLLAGLEDIVHFDRQFVRYEQAEGGRVAAVFADGSRAEGDLLVGADGSNSRVRRQFLPGAERVDTGAVGIGGRLDLSERTIAWLPPRLPAGMNVIMGPRDFLFTAIFRRRRDPVEAVRAAADDIRAAGLDADRLLGGLTDRDYLLWAFITRRENVPAEADPERLREIVSGRMKGWHDDLKRVLAETDQRTIGAFAFFSSKPVKAWASSNVTLLGDAIHNMTPAGGVGANTALRDAALLSRKLAAVAHGNGNLLAAVHDYEAAMLDYGFAAVKKSLGRTQQALAGRLARARDRTFLRVCGMVPALRRAIFAAEWTDTD
jgi:2-polyprenyl-6-methoxyphenol hydroxylase-like FAD-dependent oxidoreductase